MPRRGADERARSIGFLAGLYHEKLTSGAFVDLVGEFSADRFDPDAEANLRLVRREQDRALKIPQQLVVEISETEARAHEAWVSAREKAAFGEFAPWLERILELQKKIAGLVGYEGSVYNAFLDEYEPNARVEEIGPLLGELRDRLLPLAEAILAKGSKRPDLLEREFPTVDQESFGRKVLADLGFDLEAGRLDVSVHPFCSALAPTDVRLTTRYSSRGMTESLFGIIHECGHGLYEQGLPGEALGTPLCQAVSLGIHESQSRLWENMIGRSREFWEHYLPELKSRFPGQLQAVDLGQFHAAVNHVEATPVRVEADEVTYNLHILLRFELEQQLVGGELAVADLPGRWNDRMQEFLGIRPENDALGVLQDIHWSSGLIGYFPTYSLGNLYAAQFFDCARSRMPGLMQDVARGEFSGLLGWLRDNIHSRGARLTAGELIEEVTGAPLSADPLIAYLETKYGELYSL